MGRGFIIEDEDADGAGDEDESRGKCIWINILSELCLDVHPSGSGIDEDIRCLSGCVDVIMTWSHLCGLLALIPDVGLPSRNSLPPLVSSSV